MASQPTTRRTQRERVAESSRRLLEAAVELIAEQGYERTTAAEISRRAGYSRALAHARYGSKEALLDVILAREYEDYLDPEAAEGVPGLTQVLDRLDRLDQLVAADPGFVRAVFVLSFEAVGHATTLKPRIERWLQRFEGGILHALETGRRDGSIRSDIIPRVATDEIMAMGIGLAYRWTLTPDAVDFHEQISRWRRRLERDLRAGSHSSLGQS